MGRYYGFLQGVLNGYCGVVNPWEETIAIGGKTFMILCSPDRDIRYFDIEFRM